MMGRKKFVRKRTMSPDPKFNDVVVAKFINILLIQGKKSTAERILYTCIDRLQEKTGEDGLGLFKKALENVKPVLEVTSRRIGGANYQVPVEVRTIRRQSLAARWIIQAARRRPEYSMIDRLTAEIL